MRRILKSNPGESEFGSSGLPLVLLADSRLWLFDFGRDSVHGSTDLHNQMETSEFQHSCCITHNSKSSMAF